MLLFKRDYAVPSSTYLSNNEMKERVSVLIKYNFNKMKGNKTMNETTKKNKDSNRIATIMAVVLSLALILAGTYAFTDFAQHSTNPFSGGEEVSVTLNDNYTPPVEWLSGQTVNKQVSVTNTDQSNRNVYVRLQLKEYMESYNLVPVQESGGNVLFATYADGANKGEFMTWADAVAGGYDYTEYIVNGVSYARTSNDELRNGIYGKAMYIYSDLNIYGTADKADYIHDEQHTDECDYNVHMWDGASLANRNDASDTISDYISWTLGTDVMLMSDWLTSGKPTGNFWVLDDTDSEGWLYWATAIAPGESTSNILESVTLDVMPGASFEYYIHIDMEAVTLEDLDKWITNGTSINGEDLVDTLILDAKIIVDQNDVKYLICNDENVYEVLNDDRTSQSPVVYILDLDGSLASNGETNGDEYYCDENGLISFDTTNMEGNLLFPDTQLREFLMEGLETTKFNTFNILTPNAVIADVSTTSYTNYTQSSIDTDNDGKLSLAEINAVKELYLNNRRVVGTSSVAPMPSDSLTSLDGLEIFTNLEIVQAYNFNISSFSAPKYPKLKGLFLGNSTLANLDLTHNPELETLTISASQISSLDLSNNSKLRQVEVTSNNNIQTIDFSANKDLEILTLGNNTEMTSINIYGLAKLKYMNIGNSRITTLDASSCTSLESLYAYWNLTNPATVGALTSLDVSGLTNLKTLSVFNQSLTSLNVSDNTALTVLYCYGNQISSLDVSSTQIVTVANLRIQNNGMTSLTLGSHQTLVGTNASYTTAGNSLAITRLP